MKLRVPNCLRRKRIMDRHTDPKRQRTLDQIGQLNHSIYGLGANITMYEELAKEGDSEMYQQKIQQTRKQIAQLEEEKQRLKKSFPR